MRGERNLRPLVLKNVGIWNEWPFQKYLESEKLEKKYPKYSPEWTVKMGEFVESIKLDEKFAKKFGDLGPVYGFKWRNWVGANGKKVDQLQNAVNDIKNNSDSRRIIVTAWDPSVLSEVALPPCHMSYQFQVVGKKLNCFMVQRSVDTFLGLPFNIASYALLTCILAKITGKIPGELTMALADTHLYLNHIEQAKEQIKRKPKSLPKIKISSKLKNIDKIESEWIEVVNYDPHPPIKAPISV